MRVFIFAVLASVATSLHAQQAQSGCGDGQFSADGQGEMTREEYLAALDAQFFGAVSGAITCDPSSGGGGGASGSMAGSSTTGSGNGQQGAEEEGSSSDYESSPLIAENPNALDQGDSQIAMSADMSFSGLPTSDTRGGGFQSAASEPSSTGKEEDDLEETDNDAEMIRRLRERAEKETNPVVRKKLLEQLAKYEGEK